MLTWQGFFLVRQQRQTEVGTLQQPLDTEVTDWEERARLTMLHLLVGWCCEGRGHWCGRACAIIRERNWLEVSVRSLMASTYVFVFRLSSSFFFVRGLCRYWKPWRMSYKQAREHRVTCEHGSRGLCACTYHSAPPCLRYNVAIQVYFSLSRWKFRLHSRLQRMTSL